MWWTTLLVLVALGGAGLAVAADRQGNPVQRPELTWRADQDAKALISPVVDQLAVVERDVSDVSAAGRHVLEKLQALDLPGMNQALADGNDLSTATDSAVSQLISLHDAAIRSIDQWRLGPETKGHLDQLGSAGLSAQQVPAFWDGLAADAQRVAGLVDDLLRHDGLAFQATTAGRQARWDDALSLLDQAKLPLAYATAVRDQLANTGAIQTLDELLARYRAYDAALAALYGYVRDTGLQTGDQFDSLQAQVEQAQAALPSDTTAISDIVGEAAGPSVTAALVQIEQAHGDILDALDSLKP
jgi:hypothetical protein